MSLFRRFFYKNPPDRLLEISERVYVFDSCLSNNVMGEDEYTLYLDGVVAQLHDHFPEASFLVSNFGGEQPSQTSQVLSQYGMTVMDYPCHYKSCPLLPLEMIHHFLRSSESWLTLGGQQNVLLLHCETSAWPLLAFMLSALLLYRKQYESEEKTLEMVYKKAPEELLHLSSQLNPHPSQLRYLHYISKRNLASDWLPLDTPLLLGYLILRDIPHFEGREGCRPMLRVYRQDPMNQLMSSIPVFSTPKTKKHTHLYQKEECKLVKLDLQCYIQGDVVIECIHLHDDLVHEEMIFRIMFHAAFVRGNVLVVQRDEMDIRWDGKDQFPKELKAEVHFSGADDVVPTITTALVSNDSSEEFFEVEEILSNVIDNASSHDSKGKKVWKGEDVEHNAFLVSNHKYDMHAKTSTDPPHLYGPSPLPPLPTGVREHGSPPPPPPPPPLNPGKTPPAPGSRGSRVPPPPPPFGGPKPLGGGYPPTPMFGAIIDLKSAQRKCDLLRPMYGAPPPQMHRPGGAPPPPPPPPTMRRGASPSTPPPPCGKPPPPPGGHARRRHCLPQPLPLVVFRIELSRACNIETMLTKLHMPLPDMIAAVLAMDETVLNLDQIDNLIKFCPTKEEMEFLKHYNGPGLGDIEKYFLELMKVPRVESKLRVFSFKIQFGPMITELKNRLITLNSACEEVFASQKLKEVMKEIIYMEDTTNQEPTSDTVLGFKLDSFIKLSDTHATNSNMTLVHYLCKELAYKAPVLLEFHTDLESLESASKIRLKSLAEEMQVIVKGVEKLNQELIASESDGPVSEVFCKTLKDFIPIVETEVAAVLSLYSATGKNADALSVYFGEDPYIFSFEEVIRTLLSFINSFKKAHEENIKQEELEKNEKASEEMEIEKEK